MLRRPPRRWFVALALVSYGAVIAALTLLKAFFQVGQLWRPENQLVRQVLLEPFELMRDGTSTFGVVFDYLGNIALFVPLGVLLVVALRHRPRAVLVAVGIALGLSLGIETAQYVFSVGRSSTDDVIFNVLGAALGAGIARGVGPRWDAAWSVLALVVSAVFVLLVCGT